MWFFVFFETKRVDSVCLYTSHFVPDVGYNESTQKWRSFVIIARFTERYTRIIFMTYWLSGIKIRMKAFPLRYCHTSSISELSYMMCKNYFSGIWDFCTVIQNLHLMEENDTLKLLSTTTEIRQKLDDMHKDLLAVKSSTTWSTAIPFSIFTTPAGCSIWAKGRYGGCAKKRNWPVFCSGPNGCIVTPKSNGISTRWNAIPADRDRNNSQKTFRTKADFKNVRLWNPMRT